MKHRLIRSKFEECAALQVAVGAKVADHLYAHPDGMHVSELGERTGLSSDKLARILRLLATKHTFREGDRPYSLRVVLALVY